MENQYFKSARRTASAYLNKRDRLVRLLLSMSQKMNSIDWKSVRLKDAKERLSVFARIVKAYMQGTYRQVPWRAIVSIVAAIVYFVNPFDLVPDFIPVLGLTDDVSILIWVYSSVKDEIDRFLEWDRNQVRVL